MRATFLFSLASRTLEHPSGSLSLSHEKVTHHPSGGPKFGAVPRGDKQTTSVPQIVFECNLYTNIQVTSFQISGVPNDGLQYCVVLIVLYTPHIQYACLCTSYHIQGRRMMERGCGCLLLAAKLPGSYARNHFIISPT